MKLLSSLIGWLDHRTGVKKLAQEALYESIPGGARWRYVWGSTLTFALFIQFVTGIFLWMSYNPSAQTAWESVYYIQYELKGGWLLRGLHHFTAQLMTILLVLHLMQVVIDGAYKAPREVNFWFGLILLKLVLALSLTGYLLPWDQKGFWATKVTTNIIGITPVVGPALQKLLIGGADYGHATLSRFFALHAGVLPAAVIALLVGHIYLFRRHGVTAKRPLKKPAAKFWPDQVLMDGVACLAVLAAVLLLIVLPRFITPGAPMGAGLGAPADPSDAYSAARPEWYFLFLFQFLKYFPGESEIWGAIIIPGMVMTVIFLMPFAGNWKRGHRFNLAFLAVILLGAGALTLRALNEDKLSPDHQRAVQDAERQAGRARELASMGIPREGALALMASDPLTQGPKLFAKNCASCHRYDGHDGLGHLPADQPSASDLKGFADRNWVAGLLDPEKVATHLYFGGTKFADGKMVRFVRRTIGKFDASEKESLAKVVAALSAEAQLSGQAELDKREADLIKEGQALIRSETMECADCHAYGKPDDTATAPDLTGFGSRKWLIEFIANPAHESFYGKRNDRMPAFGEEALLDERGIGLIADWLRGDWPSGKTR